MSTFINVPLNSAALGTPSGSLSIQIAENFLGGYRTLYGGTVITTDEKILMLVAFKNYLNTLTGLGSISPALPPAIVSGSWAAANALSGSGYFI